MRLWYYNSFYDYNLKKIINLRWKTDLNNKNISNHTTSQHQKKQNSLKTVVHGMNK